MPPANPRFAWPRVPGFGGRIFSRQHFLDRTLKCYYGPGQPPDAGEPGRYKPPTDWNPAGSLLRPPQVAWLYLSHPSIGQFSHVLHSTFAGIAGSGQWGVPIPQSAYYADGTFMLVVYASSAQEAAPFSIPWPCSIGSWTRYPPLDDAGGNHAYYCTNAPDPAPYLRG